MVITRLTGQTCQIFRPVTMQDGYGDPGSKAYPATPTATHPCRLQLQAGNEDRDGRDAARGSWLLFLPGNAQLAEHDQVLIDGKRFDVISVYPVNRPGHGTHHLRAQLQSYAGTVPHD